MAEVHNAQVYVAPDRRSIVGTFVTGALVGVFGWLLSLAVRTWIIDPVFCHSTQSFSICANGGTVAWTVAMIITSIVGLLVLVKSGVFRPLLIIIAAFIALWGVSGWLGPLPWWQAMLWHGGLFAVAYGLFAWVARVKAFLLALVLTIGLIIVTRLVVTNS